MGEPSPPPAPPPSLADEVGTGANATGGVGTPAAEDAAVEGVVKELVGGISWWSWVCRSLDELEAASPAAPPPLLLEDVAVVVVTVPDGTPPPCDWSWTE